MKKFFDDFDDAMTTESLGSLWKRLYEWMEDKRLIDVEYAEKTDGLEVKDVIETISSMDFDDCCTWLTWILRGERFCEGLFESCVKDGSLHMLIQRCCELVDK